MAALARAVLTPRRFRRDDTTVGPMAFGGRTITLVARTTVLRLGGDAAGMLRVRSRPLHVEVLDDQGGHEVVRIRDVERSLVAGITVVGLAAACTLRALRKSPAARRPVANRSSSA